MNLERTKKKSKVIFFSFGRKEGKEHSWKEKIGLTAIYPLWFVRMNMGGKLKKYACYVIYHCRQEINKSKLIMTRICIVKNISFIRLCRSSKHILMKINI